MAPGRRSPTRDSRAEPGAIRIGAVFPQLEIGSDPAAIRQYATAIERIGYRHLLAYDHVVGGSLERHEKLRNRYTADSLFHEVFVLFGFLAAVAPSLELVTGVLILPQRQAVLVAKQAAEIDVLTGGRFRLGVGIGWNDLEYEALNEPFRNRARRFVEQIDVMRQLWTTRIIDYNGEWHRLDHVGINPMPVQQPIPVWFGANAEVAIRRAARIGDGFLPNARTIEESERQLGWLRDELDRTGRASDTFGLQPRITIGETGSDEWRRQFDWWREQRATHVDVNTMGAGCTGVDDHIRLLERVHDTLTRT
jgi:probable F420-dependent oxidoreductase